MTRLTGFLLLQLAAAVFARRRIAENQRRTEALRNYCDMLEQLRGLLESDGSPMPALLETLAGRTSGEACAFVMVLNRNMDSLGRNCFRNLWQRALEENTHYLDEDTVRDLNSLGAVLGLYDPTTQLEALSSCRGNLRRRLDERQRTQTQDSRVIFALSLSASLLAGIILI